MVFITENSWGRVFSNWCQITDQKTVNRHVNMIFAT